MINPIDVVDNLLLQSTRKPVYTTYNTYVLIIFDFDIKWEKRVRIDYAYICMYLRRIPVHNTCRS